MFYNKYILWSHSEQNFILSRYIESFPVLRIWNDIPDPAPDPFFRVMDPDSDMVPMDPDSDMVPEPS